MQKPGFTYPHLRTNPWKYTYTKKNSKLEGNNPVHAPPDKHTTAAQSSSR